MSDKKEEKKVEPVKSKFKFYKNEKEPALRFVTEGSDTDPTKIKYAGFTLVRRNVNGYYAPIGVLKTDNVAVQERVAKVSFISEIEEKEYKKILKG